jgi:hypothetical protein
MYVGKELRNLLLVLCDDGELIAEAAGISPGFQRYV